MYMQLVVNSCLDTEMTLAMVVVTRLCNLAEIAELEEPFTLPLKSRSADLLNNKQIVLNIVGHHSL